MSASDDPDYIADRLEAASAAASAMLRQRVPTGDWVDAFVEGDVVTTDIAAGVANCSVSTIRRRCAEAAQKGRPIGILIATSIWLVSLKRLLDWITQNEGLPARLEAETRARKNAELKRRDQDSMRFDRLASGEASIVPPESVAST